MRPARCCTRPGKRWRQARELFSYVPSSCLRLEDQDCRFFLVVGGSRDVIAIEFRRPKRRAVVLWPLPARSLRPVPSQGPLNHSSQPRSFHPSALRLSRGTFYFAQTGTFHFAATGMGHRLYRYDESDTIAHKVEMEQINAKPDSEGEIRRRIIRTTVPLISLVIAGVCLWMKFATGGWVLILFSGFLVYPALCVLHVFVHWRLGKNAAWRALTLMVISHVLFVAAFLLQYDFGDVRGWLTITALLRGVGSDNTPRWWPASLGFNYVLFLPWAVLGFFDFLTESTSSP
jgi:hypothetical protein